MKERDRLEKWAIHYTYAGKEGIPARPLPLRRSHRIEGGETKGKGLCLAQMGR